jgi:HSP20 family protein
MATLDRRDPFTDLATSWQRDIDRMFRGLAETFPAFETLSRRSEWMPTADVLTRGDDIVIRLELPGMDPERDVEITVEDGMLHIHGERKESEEEEGQGYIRRESSHGAFERTLALPAGARTDDIKATYEKGVLEIVVPGAGKRPTQRVQVEVAGAKGKGKE